jgi:tripartite-type tricarboxylate transporter receptor subunit TctC
MDRPKADAVGRLLVLTDMLGRRTHGLAIVKMLKTPEMKAKIVELGAEPIGNSPAEMDKFLREDRARWAKLIQETGLKLEQ